MGVSVKRDRYKDHTTTCARLAGFKRMRERDGCESSVPTVRERCMPIGELHCRGGAVHTALRAWTRTHTRMGTMGGHHIRTLTHLM